MGGGPFYLAATGSFMRVSLQRFPNSPPEIRNHCSRGVVLEGFLAAIPKSGLEIKNHCSRGAVLEGFLAAIPKSRPEIKNHCSPGAILEAFLAASPKSGPEIKNHCSHGLVAVCRRNHSTSQQQRLESDAEDRCRYDRSRRNHSPSQQRRLESDADIVATTTVAGETILLRSNED